MKKCVEITIYLYFVTMKEVKMINLCNVLLCVLRKSMFVEILKICKIYIYTNICPLHQPYKWTPVWKELICDIFSF